MVLDIIMSGGDRTLEIKFEDRKAKMPITDIKFSPKVKGRPVTHAAKRERVSKRGRESVCG